MQVDSLPERPSVAYFSMETALDPALPTYSGGLGVLAGDILRSAADLGVSMAGITLLHRKGYFRQQLDASGSQSESPHEWSPEERLEPLPIAVTVQVEGRPVRVRPWLFRVAGINGHTVPVFLLDTDLAENDSSDRRLTDHLYGGDERYRLCQEVILGIGGVAVLRELGYGTDLVYHMNEGHSSLLALALLEETQANYEDQPLDAAIDRVRERCVFTTHTPVPAGHDQFPTELVSSVLGSERASALEQSGCLQNGVLNMTYLGLRFSHYVNGVSMRHGEVSLDMFPGYPVEAITNGVHAGTWVSGVLAELYDRYMPGWRQDNRYLRYAIKIPLEEISRRHRAAKHELIESVERCCGARLREEVFTIGFARRATPYKRADLLLNQPARLKQMAESVGSLQILYGGKAHPRDEGGKELIRRIVEASKQLGERVRVVYLEDYDWSMAQRLVAGTDLWLNNPRPPREASGTSGMKAACNGVPSLSVLDGWWIEGHIEGVTGWSIPQSADGGDDDQDAAALYDKLEKVILPLYYKNPSGYTEVRRSAIALNASFFNTQRVVSQYVMNAYS